MHLAGVEDEAATRAAYQRDGKRACVMAFCAEMDQLYAAADLVIARAGASSLAEIAQQSLPSILAPYPFAADDHQRENARIFSEAGAAIMCEERSRDAEWLAKEIGDILSNPNRRKTMSDATKRLRHEDAHRKLADMVEGLKIKN